MEKTNPSDRCVEVSATTFVERERGERKREKEEGRGRNEEMTKKTKSGKG